MKTLTINLDVVYSDVRQAQESIEQLLRSETFETGEVKEAESLLEQARRRLATMIKIKVEKEAMANYEKELEFHVQLYNQRKPKREDYTSDVAWHTAFNQWSMDEAMNRPNKPGYYRANND
jgi:hypothetical protein